MFLKPRARAVRGGNLYLLWWPFALVSFDSCPGSSYLVDLVVASESRDPLPLILTMRRYKGKGDLEPSPPVEAPIVIARGSGPGTIMSMILEARRRIDSLAGQNSMRIQRSQLQSIRVRRPHTLEEAIANPISRGILSEILSSICIERQDVRIASYSPIYILVGISRSKSEFYIYMDKRYRSTNHEIYALKNTEIKSIVDRYTKPEEIFK
jgi:hypothetical protein